MCGIAGIISNNNRQKHLEILLERMQTALRHRGPDDRGIFISQDRRAALAHTRLSILDLTAAGHQPMSTTDGRYWITFNGEIYNFKELRRNLEDEGEQFHSQTDTEVILKLYQRFAKDCVNHLRGMFAFAIWDDLEKTCFIARDPLGIKPLYYWQSGSTLVIASELRAILASGLPSISLNPEGLYGYLTTGSVPEPNTLIEGIQCLEAGHWLNWQSGSLQKHQYWQIDFTPQNISVLEAQEKVRQALIDSIEHHFVSDVPVGIFLSGGIDSTSVLALARQTQTNKLRTYSITFEEPEWNEGDLSRKIAQQFDTDHKEYQITASLGRELFSKYLDSIDQPSIDGFNTFCVSQLASQDGTKVVLSGLGGDELFGGYKSFQTIPQLVHLSKKFDSLQIIRSLTGKMLVCWSKSPKIKRLGDFLQQEPTVEAAYHTFRGIFADHEARELAHRYLEGKFLSICQDNLSIKGLPSLEDRVSMLEISRYMRNQLLRDSDVMSMAHGLELRVPLVDRVLLETISSIPSNIRLAPQKQLLTQAIPELPFWILNLPKRGFSFPLQQWIGNEWNDYFPNVDSHKNISLKLWYRRWSLVLFNHWWHKVSI